MALQPLPDTLYMRRCLQLAAMAAGHTSPNPVVGAVVVCDGHIIGEGYHRRCGEGHAEVNAIASVRDKSLLSRATIYVSLEPCSHFGKTPPCCDLIIASGIRRVVVGCLDPFPRVAGRGVERLRNHGIDVTVGVLEEECLALNRPFITLHTQNRPYIILKWAESTDHFIDRLRHDYESPTILSDAVTRARAHRLRALCDAIIVGTRTAIADNPSLTVRHWSGKNPLRITIDRHGRIPATARIFDAEAPTLLLGHNDNAPAHVEQVPLSNTSDTLDTLITELKNRQIESLLVEGGAQLLQSFIDADLWDEAYIETAPICLGTGIAAPQIENYSKIETLSHSAERYTRRLTRR